jgi:hypothetical protein
MGAILHMINSWRELIIAVFTNYPLAGALVTLAGVGAFFWLEELRPKHRPVNFALVLFGWAIAVPILGWILSAIGEIYSGTKTVLSILGQMTSSLYGIYSRHPILSIVVLFIGIASYFVWAWRWPYIVNNRLLRLTGVAVGTVLTLYIVSPLPDFLLPETKEYSVEQKLLPAAVNSSITSQPTASPKRASAPKRALPSLSTAPAKQVQLQRTSQRRSGEAAPIQ